jgi:MFS family permease
MCLGGVILGYAVACLQMYRFGAVELVPAAYRAKAISWVTAGGVVAGIIGPTVAHAAYDIVIPLYLGTYAAIVVVHVIVLAIMAFIKFPPMSAPEIGATGLEIARTPPRPLWQIAAQPRFAAAVIAAMVAYGTMSFLMSASPLAIVGCGLPQGEAHWVIFLHVMGMFVPSFYTGNLISRFGVLSVMGVGAMTLLLGVLIALHGIDVWNFRIALTLNGVGWNFLYVGATALVTTCYKPSERAKAQALNDFLIFGTTATSSFLAGFLQDRLGWFPLNQASILLISISFVAVAWLWLQQRRPAAVSLAGE